VLFVPSFGASVRVEYPVSYVPACNLGSLFALFGMQIIALYACFGQQHNGAKNQTLDNLQSPLNELATA